MATMGMTSSKSTRVGATASLGGAIGHSPSGTSKMGFSPSGRERKYVRGALFAAAEGVALAEQSKLAVVGAGAGGVPEMVRYMAEDEVMWALLRFDFGDGAFKRTKIVFMHFNGEATPVIRRGQANALSKTVTEFMRNQGRDNFHASIQFKLLSEVTVENIMGTVSEYFIVDSIAGSSTANMLKEYHEQVAKEKAEAERKKQEDWERHKQFREERKKQQLALTETFTSLIDETPDSVAGVPQEKSESSLPVKKPSKPRMSMKRDPALLLQLSIASLKQVGSDGLWNWILLGPDVDKLPMLGGGSGGVDEMRATAMANQDLVMYGLIRLNFESGNYTQTRFAMLHLVGDEVSTMKRGRFNALRPRMEKRLREFANVSAVIADCAPKDVTLDTLLDKLGSVQDRLIQGEAATESKVAALRAYQESLIKEQADAVQARKPMPQQVLLKVIQEDEVPEGMDEEVVEELKKFKTMSTMGADDDDDGDEDNEEDADDIIEEDDQVAPHADMSIEEVVDLVRNQKICNWALVKPRPKAGGTGRFMLKASLLKA